MYLVLSYVENGTRSFHDSAPISSAALLGRGGGALGVKAIGSIDGNGLLSWKGGPPSKPQSFLQGLVLASFIKLGNGRIDYVNDF